MISQRQGSALTGKVHGNKYGTNQSDGYIRADGRNDYSGCEPGSQNGAVTHDIAYISSP
jgi:hypothetical protein